MSPVVAGVAGIGFLILLFLLRMPVAFAMALKQPLGFSVVKFLIIFLHTR